MLTEKMFAITHGLTYSPNSGSSSLPAAHPCFFSLSFTIKRNNTKMSQPKSSTTILIITNRKFPIKSLFIKSTSTEVIDNVAQAVSQTNTSGYRDTIHTNITCVIHTTKHTQAWTKELSNTQSSVSIVLGLIILVILKLNRTSTVVIANSVQSFIVSTTTLYYKTII